MNNNGLHKHYEKLKARERFALLITAEMRDDDGEVQALVASAPWVRYRVSDYTPFSEALREVELAYVAHQLRQCAGIWQAMHLSNRDDSDDRDGFGTVQALAYRLCQSFDGWAIFCRDVLQIPAPGPVKDFPGYADMVLETLELARDITFSRDEMADWLAERLGDDRPIAGLDPQDSADSWAHAYTHIVGAWR
jgi:hypothetical protein